MGATVSHRSQWKSTLAPTFTSKPREKGKGSRLWLGGAPVFFSAVACWRK